MDKKLQIIGLSGTNGAGKDAVGQLLAAKHNYMFISVTDLLREELKRRGLAIERKNMRALSAEWRRQYGLAVLIDRALEQYQAASANHRGVVMASLRNPYEADRVHELGGTVMWVDADPKVRYQRIQANAATRGRGGEDNKTFGQFLAEEQAEMHQSGDKATLNMGAVQQRADVTVLNNGDSLDVLLRDVDTALGLTDKDIA
ncbi:MAG TPA: AAA family ATPase [Nevskiaceae bacterium]|nr:AAA family ATPase [Nevskiaceae bacterium]